MSWDKVYDVLPEIPRIYTALAEWLACMVCILKMRKSGNIRKLLVLSLAVLTIQSVFLVKTDGMEGIIWILCMAIAVAIMYAFILVSCNMNLKDAGYCCVRSFVLAEFMASLEWEVECFFRYDLNWNTKWNSLLWIIAVYGGTCLVCGLIERKFFTKEELEINSRELISYIIIGMGIFIMSNLGHTSLRTPFSVALYPEIFIIRTMIDFGGVVMLYAYHIQRVALHLQYKYESMQNILYNHYIQYQQSQEAIDLINYKYHDLKNYIFALRSEGSEKKRNDYLKQMEIELGNYDVQCKTGNKILDTLLTIKNLYCKNNQIVITYLVDGALLSFMDDIDICTVFGNALDNAIEYEQSLPEEKRMIQVTAFQQKNFLIIRFDNYYEGKWESGKELPPTTKRETRFHGYGLKSLCYTVHKYGGETDISVEENWFSLKILIPMKR